MKPITIRGIPAGIEKMIRRDAEAKGISLNKAFIGILEKATGVKREGKMKRHLYHDLDHLSGQWKEEEARIFQKNLDTQRKIEEGLWKKTES